MYVFDTEYLVAAADPDEYYRVSEPVREREPDGDRGAGDRGDGGEHGGGGGVLQDSGREAEDVSSSLLYVLTARGWTLSIKYKSLLRSKVF